MIQYQRKNLADNSDIGAPADLPPELVGLADDSLADLSWADPSLGYSGQGFIPVTVADPGPPAAVWISVYAFYQLFHQSERIAIFASTDPVVQDFIRLIGTVSTTGPTLNLDDPQTIAGVNYLEHAAHVIASGRAVQILANTPPA